MRRISASALSVIKFTSIPVSSLNRSSAGLMSSSERAEYTLTSAALTQPAAINAAQVASDNSCFLIIDIFLKKSNYLIRAS